MYPLGARHCCRHDTVTVNKTDKEAHSHGAHNVADEDSWKEKANTPDGILESGKRSDEK